MRASAEMHPNISVDMTVDIPGMKKTDMKATPDTTQACNCQKGDLCVGTLCVPDISRGAMQRENLPQTPNAPRFIKPDKRVWPADIQSPILTLWYQDAYAAISITVDDNPSPDFDWWLQIAEQYNFKMTWYIITNLVDGGNDFYGTWAQFKALSDAGHELGSHGTDESEPPKIDSNNAAAWFQDAYENAIIKIEAKIPNIKVRTIGHPWGKYIRNLVEPHYIAGRGVRALVNPANKIDYLNLNSTSRGLNKSFIDQIMGTGPEGRGWFITHFHYLGKDKVLRTQTAKELAYISKSRSELWIGPLGDIAQYGQERDTATLVLHAANSKHIILSLKDEMHNSKFDHPLTIKARLPDGWSSVYATQGQTTLSSRIVEHEGVKYVLVDTVPDRGPILLESN